MGRLGALDAPSMPQFPHHTLPTSSSRTTRNDPALVSAFPSLGKYVEYLSDRTGGAFRDIRSIANAYKHLYTDSTSSYGTHSSIDSSGCIQTLEMEGDVEFTRVEEHHGPEQSKVIFTRKDGVTLEFLPVLDIVVDFWRSEIYQGA